MKLNKLFLIVTLLAAGLGFTACDDKDEYVPGAPASEHNIGFDSEQNLIMGMSDSEIKVELTRANATGELTVPIQPMMVPECMTLPKSVTFADGSATASIVVAVDSTMKTFTEYNLSFRIPEEYTNAYAADGKSPIFNITVKKEDFKVVAKGIFDDRILFKTTWEQTLEYSPLLGIYRIPDCFAKGGHWYFHFNGSNEFWFTDSEGNQTTKFASGYNHASYGMIMATVETSYPMGYDTTVEGVEGQFYVVMSMTVSAGSFGTNYELFNIHQWIEKPWEN